MAKIVFMIDGWFMRKRIMKTGAFYYSGPNIRAYCSRYLDRTDTFYRIFYYDTAPLMEKGHNPISKAFIDFSKTPVARHQWELFESIKTTPNFALRLGSVVWRNRGWLVKSDKFKELLSGKIDMGALSESDVEPHIEQKAVDMKIGLDIASIAMKRLADTLIVISGDADLVPALKLARREGMLVGLDALGCRVRPELREHVDFFMTKLGQNLVG